MQTLVIRHCSHNPHRFEVLRSADTKGSPPVTLTAPADFSLSPSAPYTHTPIHSTVATIGSVTCDKRPRRTPAPAGARADLLQNALDRWGRQTFDALFDNRQAGPFFDQATKKNYQKLFLYLVLCTLHLLYFPLHL